jgi:predicted DCC family thiol-disulfide oxidoreductase YuxK
MSSRTSGLVLYAPKTKRSKNNARGGAYLLYDSDCGPCTNFMKLVGHLDVHHQITPVSFYESESFNLAGPEMSRRQMLSSFHLVEISEEKRKVFSAGDGAIRLTKYLPLGFLTFRAINRVKFLRKFVRRVYFGATRIRGASPSCATS